MCWACSGQWPGRDPPGSPVHGIFQTRVQGWVAIAFSGQDPEHIQNTFQWIALVPHLLPSLDSLSLVLPCFNALCTPYFLCLECPWLPFKLYMLLKTSYHLLCGGSPKIP